MALMKSFISNGLINTKFAPCEIKCNISAGKALPVTPNIGAVYPKDRISFVAEEMNSTEKCK